MPALSGEPSRNFAADLPTFAADILDRVRKRAPRVHCITNAVAQNFTANVLLAAGAIPSMTISREEIRNFVKSADALLVNLGTFDNERRAAVDAAVGAVGEKPWVLDPVLIDRSPPRAGYASGLIACQPSALRLNRAEFASLSNNSPDVARFAKMHATVVALSGADDTVSDGKASITLHNGHPTMARITAMGCAGSAFVAACLAVDPDRLRATASALLLFGVAGEMAATQSRGPGSFAVAMLDALAALDRDMVLRHAKVSS
jgi:hydroxyethylthiazole kinase